MKKYIQLGLMLACLWGGTMLQGQTQEEVPAQANKWAAQVNVQHQDLQFQLQFGQLGVVHEVSFRPLYSVDIQRFLLKKPTSKRFFSGQIAFHNNLYHERWLSVKLGYGIEKQLFKNFSASLRMESGFALVKNTDVRYQYEEGKWVQAKNDSPTYADIVLGPRLDLVYRVSDKAHPIDIIGTSNLTLHLNPRVGGIPYYAVGLGARFGL